jgi:predicted phage terminase large subunit-like protein
MNAHSPATLRALLRADLASFIAKCFETLNPGKPFSHPWYIDHLAYELQPCQKGNGKRMAVCLPPRYGKSTIVSVAFPAWCLGHDPSLRILCASYAQDLAFRLSKNFRRVVESEWYRATFPQFQIDPSKCSEREIQTQANGGRFATSFGGAMTGFGGDMLILDDVIKASDVSSEVARKGVIEWLESTVFTRLDNKATGSIIVVGQRLHLLDPIGYLLDKGGWHPVILPALAETTQTYRLARLHGYEEYSRPVGELLDPSREPQEVLDDLKAQMGPANFNAQYQQRPEHQGDSYIDWSWFKPFATAPKFDFVFLSVDPAIATNSTSDWSVCMVFGVLGTESYILHVDRKRLGFDALAVRLNQVADRFNADAILIEHAGIGISLIGYLQKQKKHRIEPITPKGSKADRLIAVLPKIEQGQVLVRDKEGWVDTLRSELQAFPNGVFDDQVDGLSQFLAYRDRLIGGVLPWRRHSAGKPLQHQYSHAVPTVTVKVLA